MDKISQPRVYCSCKFKCGQTVDGYKMIPPQTRRDHARKDKTGEIYRYPSRATSPDIIQGGVSDSGAKEEPEERNANMNSINHSRVARCTCHLCGEPGRMIPRNTQRRHMSLNSWDQRLRMKDPASEAEGHNQDTMEELQRDFQRDDSYLNIPTATTASPLQENDEGREEGEQSENVHYLDDAILETVLELFSVLDHHKVSIACQKKVLKILYRGINNDEGLVGRSSNSADYRGLSLARLFTLAGPLWKGGVNEMAAPRTWPRLMEIYKINGMVVPDNWLFCTGAIGAGHTPTVFRADSNEHQTCPFEQCGIKKSELCAFSYLPLAKILTSLFQSQTFCHDILYMWRNRSDWLPREEEVQGRSPLDMDEFWHGTKFQEYTNFWDPRSTWQLPIICPNPTCKKAYRLWPTICEELEKEENLDSETGCYHFPCVDCSTKINQQAVSVKGSPLNIALMGHWDGFQAATTVQKDCWTVEVVILNGGKRPLPDSKIAKPIPLLFIPMSSKLLQTKKEYHLLQAFLKPLWTDFHECFVHGFPVTFKYPIPPLLMAYNGDGPTIVRVINMIWTGDGPAQSKIGGTLLMGYNGCRRDLLYSKSIVSTTGKKRRKVVYSQNRKQARIPPIIRGVESMYHFGNCLREAANEEERSEYKLQSGLSYYSDMWSLYDLYGFNISLDLLNDPMHSIALGVLKTFNDRLLFSCTTVEVKTLIKVLQHVTKNRPKGLGARWPRPPLHVKNVSGAGLKWKFSNYKAEEHLIFTMYCAAPILEELGHTLATPLGAEGAILVHLSRLFFQVSRKQGWTSNMLENARLHCAAWGVLTEEAYGPNGRITEHVIGNGEILDDIQRHGHHDIFWCYPLERMVSGYNNISTNQKSSELSFAQYFCRQQYSELFFQMQQDKDRLQRDQRTLNILKCSLYPRIVGLLTRDVPCATHYKQKVSVVPSIQKATELWSLVKFMGQPDLPSVQAATKGIGIGPNEGSEIDISPEGEIALNLRSYWLTQNLLNPTNGCLFRNRIQILRGTVVGGVHFRTNDLVVVENSKKDWPSLKCKIHTFFVHSFDGHYELFFKAGCYTPVSVEGDDGEELLFRTEATDMSVLLEEPSENQRNIVFPVNKLLHRFIAHPTKMRPGGNKVSVAFEFQDINPLTHLLMPGRPGCCPPWPMCNDVVVVTLTPAKYSSPLYLAWIIEVQYGGDEDDVHNSQRKVEVVWLDLDHSAAHEASDQEVFRVNSIHQIYTLLWRNILTVLDPMLFEKIELRRSSIQQWKAPLDWTNHLYLKRQQIHAPPQHEHYNKFQYLIQD